jgi:hypothetical protein
VARAGRLELLAQPPRAGPLGERGEGALAAPGPWLTDAMMTVSHRSKVMLKCIIKINVGSCVDPVDQEKQDVADLTVISVEVNSICRRCLCSWSCLLLHGVHLSTVRYSQSKKIESVSRLRAQLEADTHVTKEASDDLHPGTSFTATHFEIEGIGSSTRFTVIVH